MHKLTARNDELPTTVWIDDEGHIFRGADRIATGRKAVDVGDYWLAGE